MLNDRADNHGGGLYLQVKRASRMGEFFNKTIGKAKKTVGKATGNRKLANKGRAQSGKGKVQAAGRKVKRTLRNTKNTIRAKASKRPVRKTTVKATMGRKTAKVSSRRSYY
jgi:uncharacterized protein YjbJ (UPF0337 family)